MKEIYLCAHCFDPIDNLPACYVHGDYIPSALFNQLYGDGCILQDMNLNERRFLGRTDLPNLIIKWIGIGHLL